ncbi:MAG: amidohydrolase [Bacteroidales bacterium]|nr:amidohydrolase [Bacteroidales bacterium]MBN2749489.1 amidohydrolase [Bacteroidales bacterium]
MATTTSSHPFGYNQADIFSYMMSLRRHFHANPELSFQESQTANYVANRLEELGLEVHRNVSDHSVLCVLKGAKPGRCIGVRAELDALPLTEQTTLPFASVFNGVMHACGHDIHMAVALGVAKVLADNRDSLCGTVVFVFESGEELLPGGARGILESDIFKRNIPDIMLGMHVLPELEAGKVGFRAGQYMASSDEVYITVHGKGGHAALPNTVVDPVLIASHVVVALQQVVSRNAQPIVPTVLSFGKVTANGANNVIPNQVLLEGTFRTMDEHWRGQAHQRIASIAKGISESMGGTCTVDIRSGYASVYNNEALTQSAVSIASDLLGEANVVALEPRMTADDFAFFSQTIPSLFFRLGVGFFTGSKYGLHNPKFNANEDSMGTGVKVLLAIISHNMCR